MDLQEAFDAGFEALKVYVDAEIGDMAQRLKALEDRPLLKGDPGKDVDPAEIERIVSEALEAIPPALPGKDADPAVIAEMVAAAMAEIPPPSPGKSVTVEDVAPLLADLVDRAVKAIPAAKDGIGVAGALIDRDGVLTLTSSDGATHPLGVVVGRDADMAEIERIISEKIAGIPIPKDGLDGLGFDDMDLVETEDGFVLRFVRGDQTKDFPLPVPVDRGVWVERKYKEGAGVTWGGSWWVAKRDTDAKPDTPDSGWRLAVKRGRDGKDATAKSVAAPSQRAMR